MLKFKYIAMNYRFKSLKKVLDSFFWEEIIWVTEMSFRTGMSKVVLHKYVKELVKQKKLKKIWKPPHTKYKKSDLFVEEFSNNNFFSDNPSSWFLVKDSFWKKLQKNDFIPDFDSIKIMNEIFYKFSSNWELLISYEWFKKWCNLRKLNIKDKLNSYIKINSYIKTLQNSCWLINSRSSFEKCFKEIFLDELYYSCQYKWMEFWRWKLAEMTFYAKQSQDKKLIKMAISQIIEKLECIIRKEKFDAIAIVPWSIKRQNQLLELLKSELKFLNLPFVNIIKYYPNNIPIPQKSLKSREQRIINARNTIVVYDKNVSTYSNVFLIDDFVWSGSTLNETAFKLKQSWVKKVTWFAFVWNLDLNYEIINEI